MTPRPFAVVSGGIGTEAPTTQQQSSIANKAGNALSGWPPYWLHFTHQRRGGFHA
ncbi:MAG: hypothetical protein ACJASC_003383 [Limimaricola cinnabarinus]|jgi:hypothetical protein